MPLPLMAGLQIGAGALQGILGGIQAHRNQKKLENLQSPTYRQNAGITDYYNKALAKYNVNPYNSAYYNQATQQANRGVASGLSALSGRGQALAGVNNLIQGRNDAMLNAGVNAENMQRQDLAQLGGAAQLKAGEDAKAFEINQMMPYQNKFNLLAQKASGGNSIANAGLSNIFGGLQSWGDASMARQIFGGNSNSGNSGGVRTPYLSTDKLRRNLNTSVGSFNTRQFG